MTSSRRTTRPCIRIGVDLVHIARFRGLSEASPLIRKLFTARERQECRAKPSAPTSYAARFAAKEAVMKCLDTPIPFRALEIRSAENNRPRLTIRQSRVRIAGTFDVSLTHTTTHALAVCVRMI